MIRLITTMLLLITCSTTLHARDIRIVGSSTVYPFTTIVGEAFAVMNKLTPIIESTGTGGGMKLFCGGVGFEYPDFTNASRAIKQSEKDDCSNNGVTPLEMVVGYDGIVFANSLKTEPLNLTPFILFLALAKNVPTPEGKLISNPFTYWNELDDLYPNTKIEVLGPPPSSGTRDAWLELVMEAGCKKIPWIADLKKTDKKKFKGICHGMREDGAYIEAGENDNLIIQKLVNNPNAFGIFGFSFLDQNIDLIQGSPLNGTVPTFKSISNGTYPASRKLYVYAKKEHISLIEGMQEFINLYLSDDMVGEDGALGDAGLIPLPEEELEAVRVIFSE